MEERYNQPIGTGRSRNVFGTPAAPAGSNAQNAPGMMNAGAAGPMGSRPNMMKPENTGAMPYMPHQMNAGMMPDMMNKPNMPNMGAMPAQMNMPNTSAMPEMMNKPNTGMMPEMMHKPNTGMMPAQMNMPNAGAMPLPVKPNLGLMPEMAPAKPNMGTMPAQMNAPNMGTMPSHMNMPNTGAMPLPAKPNLGLMPEMAPAKPNMGMMPAQMNMPNTSTMPAQMNMPNTGMMPSHMNMPNAGAMPDMINKPNMPNMGAMPMQMNMPNTMANMEKDMSVCGYKNGELPSCAPLSTGWVPFQSKNPPKYLNAEALTRGTLYPGLDLPFKDIVNKSNPYAGTPLGELMALGFVIKELNLYLDTHPTDREALEMLQSLNKLMKEGQEKYVKLYGPQTIMDVMSGDEFTWLDNPWPWEYNDKGAKENHV